MSSSSTSTATITGADWQAVADELAGALRATILRNTSVSARDWNQARAALERYENAGGGGTGIVAADLPERPAG